MKGKKNNNIEAKQHHI